MPLSSFPEPGRYKRIVYTVGDGCPPDDTGVNALSKDNAFHAAGLALEDDDTLLFIAGGNGGAEGKRGNGKGLQEAPRMVRYLEDTFDDMLAVLTDCDEIFRERFGLKPSMNTIENGRNAAALMSALKVQQCEIVAERNHAARVTGTARRSLRKLGLLRTMKMRMHPVDSVFEETNDQAHIRSEEAFLRWTVKANIHHLLVGAVPRREYFRELMTGQPYRWLMPKREAS